MKIQIKMLKRLIAVLCAATMVASGAVASVGAVGNEADKKSDDTASVSSNYTNTTNDTVETFSQKKAGKTITNKELARKEMERINRKNMHKEPKNQLSRKNDIGKEPNKKKTQGNNTKSAQKRKERKEFQKIQKEAQKAKVKKLKEEREKRKKSIEHEKKLWLDNNKKKAQEVRKKMAIVPEQKLNKDKKLTIYTRKTVSNKKPTVYIRKTVSNKKKLQWLEELANLEANKKAKPISSPKTDKVIGKTKYGLNLGKKLEGIKTGSLNKNKNKKALSKPIYTRKKVLRKKELQLTKELANLVSNQLYGKESKLNGISRLTKKTKKEEKKLISNSKESQKQKSNQVVERKKYVFEPKKKWKKTGRDSIDPIAKLGNLIDEPVEFDDSVNNLLESNAEISPEEIKKIEEEMKNERNKKSEVIEDLTKAQEKKLRDAIGELEFNDEIYLLKVDIDKLLTEEYPKPAIEPDVLDDRRVGDYKKTENSGNDEKLKSFAAQMPNNNYPNQLEELKPQDFKKIVNGLKSKNIFKNLQKKQIGQIGSLELSESFLGFLNEIDENSNN